MPDYFSDLLSPGHRHHTERSTFYKTSLGLPILLESILECFQRVPEFLKHFSLLDNTGLYRSFGFTVFPALWDFLIFFDVAKGSPVWLCWFSAANCMIKKAQTVPSFAFFGTETFKILFCLKLDFLNTHPPIHFQYNLIFFVITDVSCVSLKMRTRFENVALYQNLWCYIRAMLCFTKEEAGFCSFEPWAGRRFRPFPACWNLSGHRLRPVPSCYSTHSLTKMSITD